MIVRGHLGDRQSVRLRTDFRSRPMGRGRPMLTHHTEDTTCRIREIERRA